MKGDFYQAMAEVFTGQWREFAACVDAPLDFFIEEDQFCKGKEYCKVCPVAVECLDNAIEFDDGGLRFLTPKERNSVVMHRRRHSQAFSYDMKHAQGPL